jgi:hypothetical protein
MHYNYSKAENPFAASAIGTRCGVDSVKHLTQVRRGDAPLAWPRAETFQQEQTAGQLKAIARRSARLPGSLLRIHRLQT